MVLRVSAVLCAAFILLLSGIYLSIDRAVKLEGEHYGKVLSGMLSDVLAYDSRNLKRPVDLSLNDRYTYFCDYLCSWYRVDYIYIYYPDIENNRITYFNVSRDRDKFGELADDHMVGVTEDHVFSEEEIRAWNDSTVFAIVKNDRFEKAVDVQMRVSDDFGNRAMVSSTVSSDDQRKDVMQGFLLVAVYLLVIVVILGILMYLLIRQMVSKPASNISRKMSEYISGGKRSAIRLESNDDDEFSMMADAFNHMTEEMDRYIEDINRLGREQERHQAEVDIASAIQKGILPSENASLRNCGIKALMKPARDIGGDLYYYRDLDSSRTMAVIADVSGKGISSAMFMSMTLTLVRQFARMGYSPAQILRQVNATLSAENPRMMFVTAFVGIYDSDSSKFTYANAGHNPPYLIHNVPELLDASEGTPLGLFPEEEYKDIEVRMEDGDTVFLYTDGVNEAVNEKGEFFGTERLAALLAEEAKAEKKHFVERVCSAVREFAGEAEQNDDITMLSLFARKNLPLELDYDVREFSAIKEKLFMSHLPRQLVMDLCVAAEECFVNICSYAFDGPAPAGEKILFYFEYSNKVIMRFSDGGRCFDPRNNLPNVNEYDIDCAVGGLGRLIAFTVADSVDYEYKDGRNILTITKSIIQ